MTQQSKACSRELTSRFVRAVLLKHRIEHPNIKISEHPGSGRNRLFVVDGINEVPWLMKQALGQLQTEVWFYLYVSKEFGAAPKCLLVDEPSGIVVFEYLESAATLFRVALGNPVALFDTLPALATHLSKLHTVTCGGVPRSVSSLPLLDPVDVRIWRSSSPAAKEVTRRVQQRAALGHALVQASESIDPMGLIHGDLKLNNILQKQSGDLVIIDWELCGHGPLARDIGAVIGSLVVLWVDQLALGAASDIEDWVKEGAVSFTDLHKAIRIFLITYLASVMERGIAPPDRSSVVAHSSAWIIGRTWGDATLSPVLSPHQYLRLMVAENLLVDADQLLGDLHW